MALAMYLKVSLLVPEPITLFVELECLYFSNWCSCVSKWPSLIKKDHLNCLPEPITRFDELEWLYFSNWCSCVSEWPFKLVFIKRDPLNRSRFNDSIFLLWNPYALSDASAFGCCYICCTYNKLFICFHIVVFFLYNLFGI